MPITLNIQADVIDISSDTPRQDDIFFVDTNAWLWQTYYSNRQFPFSLPSRTRNNILIYTAYLANAKRNGAGLRYSGLVLAEIAHVIEREECKIYCQNNGLSSFPKKEYRHTLPAERARVASEVQEAWNLIARSAISADLMINEATASALVARFNGQALDGYDLLILETMNRTGIRQVITDDQDYSVVPGIELFTGNASVISQAATQGRLIAR